MSDPEERNKARVAASSSQAKMMLFMSSESDPVGLSLTHRDESDSQGYNTDE